MNPQISIEARQTVLDFITAGTSFTAYEVTLEVRRRLGTSVDVPHGEVNSIVQNMFARGEIIGYDRREDQTVQAATKPFRYYQVGGAVAAPFVAPTAPAISRSSLPTVLSDVSYNNLLIEYAFAVSEFSDEPIAITLPNRQAPTLRLRCYGAAWPQSEFERLFTLDINASDNDLRWLIPLGYNNQFRVYSNRAGTQQQFLVSLNSTTQSTLVKEAERATGEPDGLEIEIAIQARDIAGLSDYQKSNLSFLAVVPRVYENGNLRKIEPFKTALSGDNWILLENEFYTSGIAMVGKASYNIPEIEERERCSGSKLVLRFGAGELELKNVSELKDSPQMQAAIAEAIDKFEADFPSIFSRKLESAPNLWDAKIVYAQVVRSLAEPDYYDDDDLEESSAHISRLVSGDFAWRDIAIRDANFSWTNDLGGVTVRCYTPSRNGNKVNSHAVRQISAATNAQVFLDDVNGKALTRRVQMLHETTPIEVAYVLSFEDEVARANFYRATHFDTVPTRLISQLALPASAPRAASVSNRTPFDANLHQPKAPASPIMASFANGNGGSDDDFAELKNWARQTPLDNNTWPDFKRLYKAIEARLWPPMGRFRWDETESDFPATPIPNERDLALLGVLMGRLDEINASRGAVTIAAPQPTLAQRALNAVNQIVGRAAATTSNGPSDDTLAYMKRRATKLLKFLRDNDELSAARRDALAPIVSGLLQRDNCADVETTLVGRLKLAQTDVLANNPGAIARVWADVSVSINIARWSYNWLESRGQNIAVTPAQLQRFVELGDVDWTLKLAPFALQSGEKWPKGFNLKKLSRILQGNEKGKAKNGWINDGFLRRRDEIINLFARFPRLELDEKWLSGSLSLLSDKTTLDWLAPWLDERAQHGEFELIAKMSPALQIRFNAAILSAHSNGFSLEKWRDLSANSKTLALLSPVLRALPISSEIADFIWALSPYQRDPILRALEDNPALLPIIEEHARQLDLAFIAPLSVAQWAHFARIVSQTFPAGLSADDWAKIAELPFETGYDFLPLGAGFWQFALPLETELRAQWIARVGAERAAREFIGQSADVFEELLDSDASGLEILGDAWLDANLAKIALDSELIIKLSQSAISDWQTRALSHLASAELRLPVALRLMESELPILERVAAPFFRDENSDWSDRVLALADSPKLAARALALQLLAEFPARWTPDLLRNLAQHDDAGVQAFVASQLQNAPANVVESRAIETFDGAIINARGRARRAKESVKARVSEGEFNREILLDAARNGAARDREWALQQLVLASLAGEKIEGLEVSTS